MIGKCPHCQRSINKYKYRNLASGKWIITSLCCPDCDTIIGTVVEPDKFRDIIVNDIVGNVKAARK